MSDPARVLLLGLDAAEAGLVQAGIADGRLPTLARLRERGVFREIASPARHYAGGVWPSFYTGRPVAGHGVFHNKLWRPDSMRVEVPNEDWCDAPPLWEAPAWQHLDCCIVDVPMLLGPPRSGLALSGWGTHDMLCRGSEPSGLWAELERRHGPPEIPPEPYGRRAPGARGGLRSGLERTTEQLERIAAELLAERPWQLGCVVFGAAHRAGHYLWESQSDLVRLYRGLDAALGRLVEGLCDETLVVAFAVHGMGPNPGWSDLFPEILERLAACAGDARSRQGLLYRIRRRVPFHWATPVLSRLPSRAREGLVKAWSRGMFDWSRTRWFPVPMDEAGYVRVNLRGREAQGVVEPGAEYEAVCAEVAGWVCGLRDAESGESIAAEPLRAYCDADPTSPGRDRLPDLVFSWRGPRAAQCTRLVSDTLPDFDFEVPRRLPSARSGNHTDHAWLAAAGPGAAALESVGAVHELLPAALAALGARPGGARS